MLAVNVSDEPRRHWAVVRDTPLIKHAGYVLGGLELLEAQLGTFMQIAPPADQVCFGVFINAFRPVHLSKAVAFNRAAAPDIYRAVHPISQAGGHYLLDKPGEAIEYALEMRRFDDMAVLSHQPWAVNAELADTLGRAGHDLVHERFCIERMVAAVIDQLVRRGCRVLGGVSSARYPNLRAFFPA